MARKDELASQLGGDQPARRPGWRDTIATGRPLPEPVPAVEQTELEEAQAPPARRPARRDRHVRKTYLLTPQMVDRIADLAARERVAINELVRFLLAEALHQVENRELAIPTRPARRRINMEEF